MTAALLFDLDGTMILSDALHAPIFFDIFAERGRRIDMGFYLAHIHGRHNEDTFAEFFPGEDARALSEAKEAAFRARLGRDAPAMPGLRALLDHAQAEGLRTAVVTNAPRENADAMLAALGVAHRFDTVVVADDCARGKPFPDPYLTALARLDIAAANALAFEDSGTGVRAAVAAGLTTVGLRSSLSDAALRAEGATLTLQDFTDPALHSVLARLKGPVQ